MPLLTLNLSCENVKYPARKHFGKANTFFSLGEGRFGVGVDRGREGNHGICHCTKDLDSLLQNSR